MKEKDKISEDMEKRINNAIDMRGNGAIIPNPNLNNLIRTGDNKYFDPTPGEPVVLNDNWLENLKKTEDET